MGGRLIDCGILIVRPAGLGDALAEKIHADGGDAILFPAIDILSAPRPAHLAMVSVCYKLQRFDQALEHMRKADELQPLEPPERQLAIHIAQLVQQAGGRLP